MPPAKRGEEMALVAMKAVATLFLIKKLLQRINKNA
jgi:hypothetical protein